MQIIREENSLASGVHLIDGFEFGLEDPSTFEPPEWMKLLEHRSATPSEIPEGNYSLKYFLSYIHCSSGRVYAWYLFCVLHD